jgi:hypothetical protein
VVWQIYSQQAQAHWQKLEAFLDLYTCDLASPAAQAIQRLTRFWNGMDEQTELRHGVWAAVMNERAALQAHAKAWCARIAEISDLAHQLANFSRDKLK